MSLWKVLGIGAAVGVGIGALVRALGSSEGSQALSEDNGYVEDRPDNDVADLERSGPNLEGLAALEALGRRGGMTAEQIRFLAFVARNESHFYPNVGRGDPELEPPGMRTFYEAKYESNNAKAAFDRNKHLFADCGHEETAYYFGSGGLFAFYPVYPLFHLRDTPLRCAHPYELFDPVFSMTAAYSFARGLSARSNFDGTVVGLRAGWGAPRTMHDPSAYEGKLPLWRKQLRQLGVDEGWLYAKAPEWPKRDLMELYRSMGGTYGGVA